MSLSPDDHTDSIVGGAKLRPKSDPLLEHSENYVRFELLDNWPQKCAFVVDEILKTEKDYIIALEDVMKGYRNPLAGRLQMTNEGNRIIQTIFGNIEDLHTLHRSLLEQLSSHEGDPHQFGRVFSDSEEKFRLYSIYCTNYDSALNCLQEMLKQSKELGEFILSCQRELGHPLPLTSQLIKPVQRIMRYHLLLHQLVKHFNPNHYGYTSLSHAHKAMARIAGHVNEVKKQKENALRAKDIQTYLTGWTGRDAEMNLSAYGRLILESTCRVGKKGVERQVILFEKLLLILKKKDVKRYNYKGHILTEHLCIDTDSTAKPSPRFKVFSRGHTSQTYIIETCNNKTQAQWVTVISVLLQSLTKTEKQEENEYEKFVQRTQDLSSPHGRKRPQTVHDDPRFRYGSSRSKRLIGPRKRQRTDVREVLFEEEESTVQLTSMNKLLTSPISQPPLSNSTNTEQQLPDSSLKYARLSDQSELENDPNLLKLFPPRGVPSSKSDDSLLSLSDVEFGMEERVVGGVEEVDSPPPPDVTELPVRKPSQLKRKAAIKVKKAGLSASSSYQSIIKIRAKEARRSASCDVSMDNDMESGHQSGDEESELSKLIGTPQTSLLLSQSLGGETGEMEYDSLYQSGGGMEAGGPPPPMSCDPDANSLNNSGYQIEIGNFSSSGELSAEMAGEKGRVLDSGIQELEGSTNENGSSEDPSSLEASGHYTTCEGGDPGEGVYGDGVPGEGVYSESVPGEGVYGGEDFVILEDSSDSEEEDDDSFETLPSPIEPGDLVTVETCPEDILPPPGVFVSSDNEPKMANGQTSQQSTPGDCLERLLSGSELSEFFKSLDKEESPSRERPADIPQQDVVQPTVANSDSTSPVYYFKGRELNTSNIYGTLPRKPRSKNESPVPKTPVTTPSGPQTTNPHLSHSSQTLSRSAARRADGFSRLLEFTRQQQTPEMSPVRQLSAPVGLDVSQSLPVGVADNLNLKLQSLLEENGVPCEGGDKSEDGVGVPCEGGDKSEDGEVVPCEGGDKSEDGVGVPCDGGDKSEDGEGVPCDGGDDGEDVPCEGSDKSEDVPSDSDEHVSMAVDNTAEVLTPSLDQTGSSTPLTDNDIINDNNVQLSSEDQNPISGVVEQNEDVSYKPDDASEESSKSQSHLSVDCEPGEEIESPPNDSYTGQTKEPSTVVDKDSPSDDDTTLETEDESEGPVELLPTELRKRAPHFANNDTERDTNHVEANKLTDQPSIKQPDQTSEMPSNLNQTHGEPTQEIQVTAAHTELVQPPVPVTGVMGLLQRLTQPFRRRLPSLTSRSGLVLFSVVTLSSILVYAGLSYSGISITGGRGLTG